MSLCGVRMPNLSKPLRVTVPSLPPTRNVQPCLGITVMPEWFQYEGIDAVLDRLQSVGATALVTSPYVLEAAPDGEGGREPPPDGEAGKVRPLDRPLLGRTELWVRTAPAFAHERVRYAGLRYQPSPPTALTARFDGLLDRVVEAARARGLEVYLQVMAASPPGYRVQFSGAVAEDQCLGPDLAPHDARVDKNASLASTDVVAYIAALSSELATRFPGVNGIRLDWPEYPPYDLASALFDFNPAVRALMREAGHDPAIVARDVLALRRALETAARTAAGAGAEAAGRALDAAGWDRLMGGDGSVGVLLAAKRRAARSLLAAVRAGLDAVPGAHRRLEPQAFPPPFDALSGFPLRELAGVADRIGIKLYTMHWPMIARYWARDLLDTHASPAAHDAVAAAVAQRLGLVDDPVDGAGLRYPDPTQAHPVGKLAQIDKLRTAARAAGSVPVTAFVHSYGPVTDMIDRFDTARAAGLPLWINRYGYLSDAKFAALREWRSRR